MEEPPVPGAPDLSLFSLFPTVEEQIENIAQAQAEDHQTAQQHISTPAGLVPSAVIGRALTSGGNGPPRRNAKAFAVKPQRIFLSSNGNALAARPKLLLVAGLKKQNGVDEAMKARDQMGWVQAVNSFTAQAEEMVLAEIRSFLHFHALQC